MELDLFTRLRLFLAYMGDFGKKYLEALGEGSLPRITIISIVLLLLLLIWLALRSFSEVSLFNLGWEGEERALGKVRIRRRGGMNILKLPEEFVDRCRTTAFRLRPGAMLRSAYLHDELFIYYGGRRIRVEFNGPMRFYLPETGTDALMRKSL